MQATDEFIGYESLFEQAEQLDEESQDLLTAILLDDLTHFYEQQGIPAPNLLQQIYDNVANEARLVREDFSEDFSFTAEFTRERPLIEDIVIGELSYEDVLALQSIEALDFSELRVRWAGRKMRKQLAAACREEICEIEDIFDLSKDEAKWFISAIVGAALSGAGIPAAVVAAIGTLVVLFILQVGVNAYCKEYDLGEAL